MITHELYTIGHSNHTIEEFAKLLKDSQIEAIADVRSSPYSRYADQFNKEEISTALQKYGIAYVFLGNELGARPQNPAYYENGKASYQRIAAGKEFKHGMERLIEGCKKYRIALMCAEKDPLDCHRTILICRELKSKIPNIRHINGDGSIESQRQIEERLIKKTNTVPELFDADKSQTSIIYKAYEKLAHSLAIARTNIEGQ